MFGESVNTESGVSESQDDIYTITNPDLEKDEITGREEPDQIEVKVEFSSYVDEFEIDKVVRVDTGEDITDKVLKDRKLYSSLAYDIQEREQGRERDYSEDSDKELDRIRKLSGIAQGLGY
jgi:phosphoribosyl 1,2-cyclic phosphodiesterase